MSSAPTCRSTTRPSVRCALDWRRRIGQERAEDQREPSWWRGLVASLDDEALNTPLGEAAGYFAAASVRS
jgi:hypothetical protein